MPVRALGEALAEACSSLAAMMADDAEGATKVVHFVVTGARSDAEAHRAARQVADSLLVKCSLNGEDPYWGRVVSELGTAGVEFVPDLVHHRLRRGGGLRARRGGRPTTRRRWRRTWPVATSSWPATSGLGDGAAVVLATDLGLRLPRREPDHVVSVPDPASLDLANADAVGPEHRGTARSSSATTDPKTTAALLVEALPYIRRFRDKVVVVKYGGNALSEGDGGADRALASFAEDVVLLRSVGVLPGRGPRWGPSDRRPAAPAGQGQPSSATACGSPTPRPSTSPGWSWWAR